MNDTGLLSLNGIPGSGKTLDSVTIAVKHYKSENRWYKYKIALFKYNVLKFIDNNSMLKKIILLFQKIWSIKLVRFLLKGFYWFLNLFLLILFFVTSTQKRVIILLYFLFFKKIIKSFNSLDYEYYNLFPNHLVNNVYSTFPILLDKKKNIWSRKVSLYDLDNRVSFYPNSLLIIDEVQLFIDSDEYKDKEKNRVISRIGKFLQSHRHFGIKQVIFTSQSPSRIFKKGRNIVVGYLKQFKIINLPIVPFSIMRGILYYDFDYYGRYIPRDHEERKKLPFEYKKVLKIFNRNDIHSRYDSRYLALYNYQRPLLEKGTWDNFKVDVSYLIELFESDEDTIDSHTKRRMAPSHAASGTPRRIQF